MKTRLLEEGPFSPHELLEMLLAYALPRKNTNDIAHRLLDRFGTLDGVFAASYEELTALRGVGDHCAMLLRLMPQIIRATDGVPARNQCMDTREAQIEYGKRLFRGTLEESVYAMVLDSQGGFLDCICLARGTVRGATVTLDRLMKSASIRRGSSVVLYHNHPDGSPEPSREDRIFTDRVLQILSVAGLTLIDHHIIAGNEVEQVPPETIIIPSGDIPRRVMPRRTRKSR